jgi:hypothetical protein
LLSFETSPRESTVEFAAIRFAASEIGVSNLVVANGDEPFRKSKPIALIVAPTPPDSRRWTTARYE